MRLKQWRGGSGTGGGVKKGEGSARRCVAWLLCGVMLAGCAGSRAGRAGGESGLDTTIAGEDAARSRAVPVFARAGAAAAWSTLVEDAARADVVIIGENHDHPLGLASAAALWSDVLAREPGATLALEFFERDEQVALDDYLAGVTDEAGFVKAAGRTRGNYPAGHRAMVETAKAASRGVVAANAPRRYVRLARTAGFERLRDLGPEQTRLFRLPDALAGGAYRENFARVMNLNAGVTDAQRAAPAFMAERERQLDAVFRSQQVWDWTMGESVARAAGRPIVLVVGRFHSDNEGGTVQAVRSLKPDARIVVVAFVDADAGPDTSIRDEDRDRADFVIYVGEARRPRS